ncbi:MAG: TrkA family potassium uptake protein [Ruminococcus sp.]|nr:TrkA family potassium uptake protein [Ruminococcus sp.]MCI6889104.1 TrkA family potassium uptake protein [Ruminococcus sp.]MDY3213973.1 TrkA family potassium uptake protein [Ruminococcus sp.]MDY3844910.1 TrkA family potassium uptake protein [Ruminococcus sp.]CDF00848.1 trkA N-terminal domain protein [Ruminococcus sp. CAG:624]
MKSILVIGMGRFGRHLAKKMLDLGNDVMIVDKDSEIFEQLAEKFTDSYIGDCTNEGVIRSLGVKHFDLCFVTIGEDFQSSLVITSLLKRFDAKCVIAKANQNIQAELLLKIGADEVVYPEREIAEKLAVRYNARNIFDYIQLTSEYSIYEIPVLQSWIGKTIMEVDVRRKYRVNIIAVKKENSLNPLPGADYIFKPDEHIVVIGKATDVFKINAKL